MKRREQSNETESGAISTVYGVAGRRRRCSSATRVSLFTVGRNAVGGPATAAVKILMKGIGERGSNPCANYHFKQDCTRFFFRRLHGDL